MTEPSSYLSCFALFEYWINSIKSKFVNNDSSEYISDIICGITVGFIRLPLALAHGMLAEMPIQYGIYTDLAGCIIFSLFTTCRHTSVGSASFLMIILGTSVLIYYYK